MYSIIFETHMNSDFVLSEEMGISNSTWKLQNNNKLSLVLGIELKHINRILVKFGQDIVTYKILKDGVLIDSYVESENEDIEF